LDKPGATLHDLMDFMVEATARPLIDFALRKAPSTN
jgi:hypothetical protein